MRLTFIGCPFKTSYGVYVDALRGALQAHCGESIEWVASNCGCGDPVERDRHFQTRPTAYFEMRHVGDYESSSPWKRWLRRNARSLSYRVRARRYARLSGNREVLHFQQTLNAYGAMAALHWLRTPSPAAKVVTLHEIDPYQGKFPQVNQVYNLANALIVHSGELRERLLQLGVQASRIHLLPYGTEVGEPPGGAAREGLVFYGGHPLLSGKGLDALLSAMGRLRARLAERAPRVRIHGHYGTDTPPEALKLAASSGAAEQVIWLNQIEEAAVASLYRSAEIAVLPYTASFAGLAAGAAAANGAAVIGTRRAGLPEHLGECAVWVEENQPAQLAEAIERLLTEPARRAELANRAYTQARERLGWPSVAEQTFAVYQSALRDRAARSE